MVLKRRHIAKSITWRILATCVTMIIAIIVTGDIKVSLLIGPLDFAIKIVMYFFHERLWMKTKFGVNDEKS